MKYLKITNINLMRGVDPQLEKLGVEVKEDSLLGWMCIPYIPEEFVFNSYYDEDGIMVSDCVQLTIGSGYFLIGMGLDELIKQLNYFEDSDESIFVVKNIQR